MIPCSFPFPCTPCSGSGCMAFCCAQSRECLCLRRRDWQVVSQIPAVPGVSAMLFSPSERYLYQLSSEADCIHTRCTATGELLYAAPAGVFPRSLRLDASGRVLLSAGGAVNEASLLSAPDLQIRQVIATRHPCFAADFWRGGLVLVCAAEGEDIQTILYTLAAGKLRPRKLLELPGQPGAMRVCPDGETALVSTREGLFKLNLFSGSLYWNRPEWAMSLMIDTNSTMALVSDTLDGRVCLFSHQHPWEQQTITCAESAQACFLS